VRLGNGAHTRQGVQRVASSANSFCEVKQFDGPSVGVRQLGLSRGTEYHAQSYHDAAEHGEKHQGLHGVPCHVCALKLFRVCVGGIALCDSHSWATSLRWYDLMPATTHLGRDRVCTAA